MLGKGARKIITHDPILKELKIWLQSISNARNLPYRSYRSTCKSSLSYIPRIFVAASVIRGQKGWRMTQMSM